LLEEVILETNETEYFYPVNGQKAKSQERTTVENHFILSPMISEVREIQYIFFSFLLFSKVFFSKLEGKIAGNVSGNVSRSGA
jgi:hypothetical protein